MSEIEAGVRGMRVTAVDGVRPRDEHETSSREKRVEPPDVAGTLQGVATDELWEHVNCDPVAVLRLQIERALADHHDIDRPLDLPHDGVEHRLVPDVALTARRDTERAVRCR